MDKKDSLSRLLDIIDRLRGPDGCPWDRRQTADDIKVYLLDEAYEVAHAIELNDLEALKEELGDLLFQIIFLAKIAKEEGLFGMDEIIDGIAQKMIRRHPHVFGDKRLDTPEEIRSQWRRIKEMEGKEVGNSLLDGIPSHLPALHRAFLLGRKASRVGFDWPTVDSLLEKVQEELNELREEINNGGPPERISEELGDLFFVMANLSRKLNLDPELALRKANSKFIKRFSYVERSLKEKGKDLWETSLEEMDRLWDRAKGDF